MNLLYSSYDHGIEDEDEEIDKKSLSKIYFFLSLSILYIINPHN